MTRGGEPVKAAHPVAAGTLFEAEVPAPREADLTPQDIPFDIVYEDEDIAVVNKPQGLTVHAGAAITRARWSTRFCTACTV